MTKPENISWLLLGLIVALLIFVFAKPTPADASAATLATSTQHPVKALCRKCQRPPAPS